jgi:hypothetical protein
MGTKERKTPLSGALFSPPDPKLAPGTARSGKNRIRKAGINFKGPHKEMLENFLSIFSFIPTAEHPSKLGRELETLRLGQ